MAQQLIESSGLTKPFCFEFTDDGRLCKFHANVLIPADNSTIKEFAKRIINYHNLPVYLEEGNLYREMGGGLHITRLTLIGH